ncbi:hypothetical protein [Paenibacillus flagellatus]|uniref:Uncharacterized protein n=1 Tax=Paenibacillus flagellatus TaxID=2211139 RepID=A0A2V5K4F7_9BACL|nr:hypothetical protein [Paenibacillus flagellatus]PYI52553.1 hypothetical protein DLM86_20485 [Paenibacillus flagellatus]
MSSTTPNLGLHKYDPAADGSKTFDLTKAINEPYDIIDERLGGELVEAADIPVTIPQGVSIINANRTSRLKDLRVTGRTLVNLLGRDGNCEDQTKWGSFQATHTLDANNKVYGNHGFKVAVSSGSSGSTYKSNVSFRAGKYYVLVGEAKNGNASHVLISLSGSGGVSSMLLSDTTKFNILWCKVAPISDVHLNLDLSVIGMNGTYGYFDGIRLFEISAAEYAALDSMTSAQIAIKYPYVDDMKSVNAVYAMNPGRNLLPPFSEWGKTGGDGNFNVLGSYEVQLVAPTNSSSFFDSPKIQFVVGQSYALSATVTSGSFMQIVDSQGILASVTDTVRTVTFTAREASTSFIRYSQSNSGTFKVENPILNIGSTALPFEPQNPSYLFVPDCQLRSNVDGSVADVLEGKTITRRFRETVLDGFIQWLYDHASSGTGYKGVYFQASNAVINSGFAIKYDGTPLKNTLNTTEYRTGADKLLLNTNVNITIANSDSGWGDNFTPSTEEIKAYFMGWKMYQLEGGVDSVYNGSGTKAWLPQYEYIRHNGSYPGFTTTLPTRPAPNNTGIKNWESYRLQYQLAQSVAETVNYEGELLLHDGPNQIEMGTGVVVREAAKPYATGTNNQVNNTNYPSSLFKYRANTIYRFYKGGVDDTGKWTRDTTVANGRVRAYADNANFDPNAAYSVTYFALDTYTLGIAPASITGVVTANIRETVDDAVEAITGLRRDVSALQTVKAGKQQPQWIAAGLQNGWVNIGSGNTEAAYLKDEFGFVHIRGSISSGSTVYNTPIFKLPAGYRPAKNTSFVTISGNGTSDILARVVIESNGNVSFLVGANNYFVLDSIAPFRAEQ